MSVYVFLGPTLPLEDARRELDAVYLPPVSQGDVYRVSQKRPTAIGIIDGYYERIPAVWHKEILWAMAEGIHVFGASSMGALRGAELAAFGMRGVGRVFEAYRDGLLEDDDEVAVAHGTEDTGYRAVSDAMVNIRQTLAAAAAAGVLGEPTRLSLEQLAKAMFYPDRSYPAVLAAAREAGLPMNELSAFRDFLPKGRINQKRDDALAMLREMRDFVATKPPPKTVTYTFEHTEWWARAQRQAGHLQEGAALARTPTHGTSLEAVLEEVRLEPGVHERTQHGAMLRHLALAEARRRGTSPSTEALHAVSDAFRRERGLLTPDQLTAWREENDLDKHAFGQLVYEQALLEWLERTLDETVAVHVGDALRVAGDYTRLRERAAAKQARLAERGLTNPGFREAGVDGEELLRWYFVDRLARPIPEDVGAFARSVGFEDEDAFRRTLLREHCFVRP